jgi:hypothetical protein
MYVIKQDFIFRASVMQAVHAEHYLQMLQDYIWPTVSAGKTSATVFSCRMVHHLTLQIPYVRGWIRSLRDVGWDDTDLTNGLQEVQISHPVTFPVGLGKR